MKITYSVLFASLLFLAWPPIGFNAFLFIAFIPAFYLVDACFQKTIAETKKKSSNSLFYYCYIGFAIFDLASSYWIWNASAVGMIIAVLLNAFLMTLPFIFYQKMRQITNPKMALLAFIAAWMSMEYFHLHWDLSWPWFSLGNAFASSSTWVQWYEYTGVFGGTLWVLTLNALLYLALQQVEWKNKNLKTNTTKGLFAGDPRRTALYATGNAHETRYVEFTQNGQPIVYFDQKDLPAMRSRKTYLTVFDAGDFRQLPTGEWFSENPSKPIKQMPIGDPFKYIAGQGWIVRVTDDLGKVFKQVKNMHKAGKIAQYGAEGMNESKQGVAEGSENNNTTAQKIFFARSNKTPKGWSYDHVGFITQDGKQIQMSGHKGNDVYVTNDVTDDPEFPKQNIKIVSLSKPVSVPTTNSVGAENCGTFVANVLQANGIKGIDTQKIYSVFKKPQEQGVAEEMQHKKITELFDAKTAFPLQWDDQFASSGEVHAEAYDADGRVIDISFTPTGYGRGIEIVFKRGGSYDLTGQGDASRVLATVVNAISQYLQKYQPFQIRSCSHLDSL